MKFILLIIAMFSAIPRTEFQRGVVLSTWKRGSYISEAAPETVEWIKSLGSNWISIVIPCYMDDLSSTVIDCDNNPNSPTDSEIRNIIYLSHLSGLKVMLKPHVDVWGWKWRGDIGFDTEAEWLAWFSSYEEFILRYARIANESGVEYFVIGTEFLKASHRENDWRNIISLIRNEYSGKITYAANHSGEETNITWWDALDAIGIDAYYPISDNPNDTYEDYLLTWNIIRENLETLSYRWNKPIILTEIGYQSRDGAAITPWFTDGKSDPQEQADCYRAVLENLKDVNWLIGIFWWNVMIDDNDRDFSINEKQAEDIVKYYYHEQSYRWNTDIPFINYLVLIRLLTK